MKSKAWTAFDQITEIINEIDPMGFMAFAGPDEYSPEVSDILQHLYSCNTAEEAHAMVIDVMIKWFGSAGDLSYYKGIGQKLMEIKKQLEED